MSAVRKFLIKDAAYDNRDIGVLQYNTETKVFNINILTGYPISEYPILFNLALKSDLVALPQDWVNIWIRERLIPPNRQNIGSILAAAGLKAYDEFGMLMYTTGRCAQDYCYLEELISDTEINVNQETNLFD